MKKLICILLSFIFIICICMPAFAQEEDRDMTPVIVVPGIGSSAIYLNPNTEEQTDAVTIDKNFTRTLWKSHLVRTTLSVCRGAKVDADKYIDKLAAAIEPFKALACDSDGNPVTNTGIDCYWTDSLANHLDYLDSRPTAEPAVCKGLCDEIGADNVYLFNYDFRLDVAEHAVQLNDFIDNVKKEKNCDQVTLVSASLGTSVVSAYIDMYKDKNDIKRTVFLDGAFQGVSMTRLFQKDFLLDMDVVTAFLTGLAECYKGKDVDFELINKWIGRFNGTAENVVDFLKILADEEHIDSFYLKVLLPLIGNMPSLWECIPYTYFDDSINAMTELGWLNTGSGLYSKLMRYHEIQGRLQTNLKELEAKGTETVIICGYGFPGMPCTSEYNNTTDMLIDTCWASAGAVTAEYGKTITLSSGENAKYLSPDGMIYAGTCLFPESTWFCKYVQHMEFIYGSDVNKFVSIAATANIKPDLDSIKELTGYSQFTQLDGDYNLINAE